MKPRFIVIMVAMTFVGCASSGTKVTEEQASKFEKGVSTEAQIIAALGPPNSTIRTSDGSRIDQYLHTQVSARAVDFVPLIGTLVGGADASHTIVTFTFTPSGVLKDWTSANTKTDVNTGLLNQK